MNHNASTFEIQPRPALETPRFKALFCQHFECPDREFQKRVFDQCVHGHAKFLAMLLRRLHPGFFVRDRAFIEYLGSTTNLADVTEAASHFRDKVGFHAGFCFNILKLRVSGSKAIKLAYKLFSEKKGPASKVLRSSERAPLRKR